jgi:hypothetical protein
MTSLRATWGPPAMSAFATSINHFTELSSKINVEPKHHWRHRSNIGTVRATSEQPEQPEQHYSEQSNIVETRTTLERPEQHWSNQNYTRVTKVTSEQLEQH